VFTLIQKKKKERPDSRGSTAFTGEETHDERKKRKKKKIKKRDPPALGLVAVQRHKHDGAVFYIWKTWRR
jgi:hypothetical protein